MDKALADFLHKHCDFTRPVLLALSGGPDSLALLHLLLAFRQRHPLELHLAHVDHGWRKESGAEARCLESYAAELKLPFHFKKLSSVQEGNLEAVCRAARLQFFQELKKTVGIQAVLLAHHADDQAETVLKRVFEGASLTALGGLRPVTEIEGLSVWRPLLRFSKEHLKAQLRTAPFYDPTNDDLRFLRARMRARLLPLLAQEFGKEVGTALHSLGGETQELERYLQSRVQSYLDQVERTPWGVFVDLTERMPDPFELKFLVRKLAQTEECSVSREALETVVHLLTQGASDKEVRQGGAVFYIDRHRLFICSASLEWEPSVEEEEQSVAPRTGWQSVWAGEAWVSLPPGEYHFAIAPAHTPYPRGSSIGKWWGKHKVPTFLRRSTPVVWQGDAIVHEFLTGKTLFPEGDASTKRVKLSLKQKRLL
jgi:tRNA(Ile)-lysidine synthase